MDKSTLLKQPDTLTDQLFEKCTKQFAVKKIEEIREVFKWLIEKLETE